MRLNQQRLTGVNDNELDLSEDVSLGLRLDVVTHSLTSAMGVADSMVQKTDLVCKALETGDPDVMEQIKNLLYDGVTYDRD